MRTIKVTDHWGKEVELSHEEFVKRWTDSVGHDFFWLDPCEIWSEEIQAFRDRVAEKAHEEFNRLLRKQEAES